MPPREAPLGDFARDAAIRSLARQARLYPDFDLLAIDRTVGQLGDRLSPLDAAFTHALYDAAARRWLTLEFLLQSELSQPFSELEPRLRAVMLAGAAQLLLLDRVPAHAAINHAVEWAKRVIRPGAGSMANAVLRKIAALVPGQPARKRDRYTALADELPMPDGSALVLTKPCLPEDPVQRLCVATGHPRALVDHWHKNRSAADVRALCLHTLATPPIVLNVAHASAPVPPGLTAPHRTPGHAIFTGAAGTLAELLHSRDDLWVQDSASAQAVNSVADLRPRLILDLCAGQGTKTRQLAAAFPDAQIVATDIDRTRLATLGRVFAGSARVQIAPLKDVRVQNLGKADLILLDVPCSNTGVLARRPEARYRFDAAHLDSLVSVQKQIIADSIALLAEHPRGRILYSTCSLEVEEDRQQTAWIERWHPFAASRVESSTPSGLPGDPESSYSDGAFSALLSGR